MASSILEDMFCLGSKWVREIYAFVVLNYVTNEFNEFEISFQRHSCTVVQKL